MARQRKRTVVLTGKILTVGRKTSLGRAAGKMPDLVAGIRVNASLAIDTISVVGTFYMFDVLQSTLITMSAEMS